jgi:DNA-binding transcriptional LysR family regulator
MENFKLKVFRVVADTLNFRRAAEELCMTQPAVTSQVKSLEESLGIAFLTALGATSASRRPERPFFNM